MGISSVNFPFDTKTRSGADAMIFAYAVGQPRPWLGAYLVQEQEGREYVPMSWLGNGKFTTDVERGNDVPVLEEIEQSLGLQKD